MKIYTYRSAHSRSAKNFKRFFGVALSLFVVLQMTPGAFAVNYVSAASNESKTVLPTGIQTAEIKIDLCHDNQGASDYSVVQAKAGDIVTEANNGHPPDATHANDIIPPFHYDIDGVAGEDANSPYLGRNWLNGGEEIFKAGCKIPAPAPTMGGLIVIKHVVNDNGGTAVAGNFTMNVAGTNPTQSSFAGSESGVAVTLTQGSYSVSESGGPSGYTQTGNTCSGTIAAGATTTCTITNDDDNVPAGPTTGVLVIQKVVTNNNYGTSTASDFSFQVNGGNAISFEADGENAMTVATGTYTVVEVAASGYTVSYNNCSAVTVNVGATTTCVITNDDNTPPAPTQGTLTVKKVLINDNGGTSATTSFSFVINGTSTTPFESDGQNDMVLDAGIYTITEVSASGYTTTYDNCTAVALAAGGSATCTITNDDIARTPNPVLGCTDSNSNNFNSSATQDDGSCTYDNNGGGGGSSGGGGGRTIVQGSSNTQGQVLGATFEPGLPNTGTGPIDVDSTSTQIFLVVIGGIAALVSLNLASFKLIKKWN